MNFRLPPELDPQNPLFKMLPRNNAREDVAHSYPASAHKTNSLIVQMSDVSIVRDALSIAHGTVEHLKIGSQSVPSRADIPTLIHLAKEHNVSVHLGGGIVEDSIANNLKPTEIVRGFKAIGVDTVEVSNARNPNSRRKIDELVNALKQEFKVIIEVGSKIKTAVRENEFTDEMKRAIDAEPHRITIEGSGSGNCFIYDESHNIRILLLSRLLQLSTAAGKKGETIIEAPNELQSAAVLHIFGWNTRIANISLHRVSDVNEQRCRAMEEITESTKRQKLLETVYERVQQHCKSCQHCTLEEQLSIGIPGNILLSDENLDELIKYYTQHGWKRSAPVIRTIHFGNLFQ
jgi:phosphosulfolactate synthase (CoM biosynthesis protein A)